MPHTHSYINISSLEPCTRNKSVQPSAKLKINEAKICFENHPRWKEYKSPLSPFRLRLNWYFFNCLYDILKLIKGRVTNGRCTASASARIHSLGNCSGRSIPPSLGVCLSRTNRPKCSGIVPDDRRPIRHRRTRDLFIVAPASCPYNYIFPRDFCRPFK